MAAKKTAKKASKKSAKKAKRAPAKKASKRVLKKKKRVVRAAPVARRRAVKTAPKKAPKRRAPAKAAPARRAKPLQRRDGTGHLNAKYESELHARSEDRETDPVGFVARPRSGDDLVEELGEGYVASATSGEYEAEDTQNQDVTEEVGGPFVETSGKDEFAAGTDASNPKGASREPFPRT
jgi:hypothetical protein